MADRENPLADSNGSLTISENGSLLLLDQMNNAIWSLSSSQVAEDPVAQLLETGNLVVRDKAATDSEAYIGKFLIYVRTLSVENKGFRGRF